MIPKINSAHGSDTRNIINRVIEVLNQHGKTIQDLVAEGQLTEEQYAELIRVVNSLVKSGEVDMQDLSLELRQELKDFSSQLAQKATLNDVRNQIGFNDINKNLSKIDETMVTDEFKEQVAGNAPIHSTPAIRGVTNEYMASKAVDLRTLNDDVRDMIPHNSRGADTLRWGYGSLDSEGGDYSDRTDRLKSDFLELDAGVMIILENDSNIKMSVYVYTLEGEFIERTGFPTNKYTVKQPVGVRLLIAYTDDRDIDFPDELYNNVTIINPEVNFNHLSKDVKAIFPTETTNASSLQWEHGSIGSDGSNYSDRTDRIRTRFFIKVEGAVIKSLGDDERYSTYIYSYPEGEFIERTGFDSAKPDRLGGEYYVRLYMAHADDVEIENINELSSNLEILTKNGGIKEGREKTGETNRKYHFIDELIGVYSDKDVEEYPDLENVMHDEVYVWYDQLVSAHPEYGHGSLLGKGTDDLDVNIYRFTPKNWRTDQQFKTPKVVITTGVHGNEKGSVHATYLFIKKICENWKDDKILEFFRFNVEFIIVPVANPTGFNVHHRYNANGVDINRDFPQQGIEDRHESEREAETNLLLDLMESLQGEGVELWIDYHNMFFRDDGYITFATGRNALVNETMNRTLHLMGRKWQNEYEFFPQDEMHEFGYTSNGASNTLTACVNNSNFRGATLEISRGIEWGPEWSQYNKLTMETGIELLVNSLKGVIKNIQ